MPYKVRIIYHIPKSITDENTSKVVIIINANYVLILWNSISNGIKTTDIISEFKTLLKKWNGTPCICKNCIICTISYM